MNVPAQTNSSWMRLIWLATSWLVEIPVRRGDPVQIQGTQTLFFPPNVQMATVKEKTVSRRGLTHSPPNTVAECRNNICTRKTLFLFVKNLLTCVSHRKCSGILPFLPLNNTSFLPVFPLLCFSLSICPLPSFSLFHHCNSALL